MEALFPVVDVSAFEINMIQKTAHGPIKSTGELLVALGKVAKVAQSRQIDSDFVHHNPKVQLEFFWNEAKQILAGFVVFTRESEGPPGMCEK